MSFIHDNKTNPLYNQSETLLYQMYQQIFQIPSEIQNAPSWRLLDTYGGNLSIDIFRKSFSNTQYINLNQSIQRLPSQKMIGFLYEKQIKL
jgi:hypothetical protein